MRSLKTITIYCALVSLGLLFTECRKKDYDLSKGVNTEITVGGDSLTIPLGSIKPVSLGSVIDGENVDILKKSENGEYSIRLNDSLQLTIDGIKPVSFALEPGEIEPIETEMADITFEEIIFDPVESVVQIEVPKIDLTAFNIPAIAEDFPANIDKSEIPGSGGTPPGGQDDMPLPFSDITFDKNNVISIPLDYAFDQDELKRIDKVYFNNNTVIVRFDKTVINGLTNTLTDYIESFRIDFPSEYILADVTGTGADFEGSSFVITNAPLDKATNVYEASFKVVALDLSEVPQDSRLDFAKDIPYSLSYKASGEASYKKLQEVDDIEFRVSIQAALGIADADIELNDIAIDDKDGGEPINNDVDNLPQELAHLNTLEFAAGAMLKLSVSNPNIMPFGFNAGECVIELPSLFDFGDYPGLDRSTNILTIPIDDLFRAHDLPILGMNIDQDVIDGTLTISDAFNYSITGMQIGGMTTEMSTINAITPDDIVVKVEASGLEIENATFQTKSISFDMMNEEVDIDIDEFVAEEAEKLYTVGLLKPAQIDLQIKIEGLPDEIDSIFFDDAYIQFPREFKFREGDVNSDNRAFLGKGFKASDTYAKKLHLESFDFGQAGTDLTDGYFKYAAKVEVAGKAHVNSTSLSSEDIGTVIVMPTITVDSIHIARIEGKIATVIDPVDENIELDLPDIFKNENNNLDVNPVITFEVGNTMAVPVDVELTLTPKRQGSVLSDGIINTLLTIKPADVPGEPMWSKYWLAKTAEHVSDGYEAVELPNLAHLLRIIPDEIAITATPVVTGDRHEVDLTVSDNAIDFNYAVNVPLSFGKDFHFEYADTISGLGESIGDYLKLIKELDVMAAVSNQIPLDLQLALLPVDDQGRPLAGVTLTSEGLIGACNIDGTAKESTLKLKLKETESGALELLDAFKLEVTASNDATVAGMPLKADQSFAIDLKVRIPSGITIELGAK